MAMCSGVTVISTRGESALVHADQQYAAASATKVLILGALLLKDAADDTLDLNTQVQLTENHYVASDLVLNGWYDLHTLAIKMIRDSNNGAANFLMDYVGRDQINTWITEAPFNFETTILNRYFSGDTSPSLHGYGSWFDDVQHGFENFTTPRELATFYQVIWENSVGLSHASRKEFFDITDLAPATANDLLPDGFDSTFAQFFNKAGGMGNVYSSIVIGDFAHRPQLAGHTVTTEGGLVDFTNSGEVVVYAVIREASLGNTTATIGCTGYEMASEFSDANAGSLPVECN